MRLLTLLLTTQAPAALLINELQASNDATAADDAGDYDDWIELYNDGDEAVSLGGYALSDDLDGGGWTLPDDAALTVPAGGYLVLWADGEPEQGATHLDFKLSSDGEDLALIDPDGEVLDSVTFPAQREDLSQGRRASTGAWVWFDAPTPGAANGEGYAALCEPPTFSTERGLFSEAFSLTVSPADDADTVRYTLDGASPGESSPALSGALEIAGTAVVRAVSTRDDALPSDPVTHSYLFGEEGGLAVASLVMDPADLFGDEGIYTLFEQNLERPGHIAFFEPTGEVLGAAEVGVEIHGQTSATYAQKSLRVEASGEPIEADLFTGLVREDASSFNALILRNAGSDWSGAYLRDALAQGLAGDGLFETQAWRPAHLYINGEYWGIQHLRERHDERWLSSERGVDPDTVDLLHATASDLEEGNNAQVMHGDTGDYDAFVAWMKAADPSDPATLETAEAWIDVENFLSYAALAVALGNSDWPQNNKRFWRADPAGDYDGRWRWLPYDLDKTQGSAREASYPTLEHVLNETHGEGTAFPLLHLLAIEAFEQRFITRVCTLLATNLEPDRALEALAAYRAEIEPEMPREVQRWPDRGGMDEWYTSLDEVATFLEERPDYARGALHSVFGVKDEITVTVEVQGGGAVRVDRTADARDGWSGLYFVVDRPLHLEAVPDPGYAFAGWEGLEADGAEGELSLDADRTVRATFEVDIGAPDSDEPRGDTAAPSSDSDDDDSGAGDSAAGDTDGGSAASPSEGGCGCREGSGSAAWLLLLAPLLLRRRGLAGLPRR
jgi:hypothetical protein